MLKFDLEDYTSSHYPIIEYAPCECICPGPCYSLTANDCMGDVREPLITDTELAQSVGKVIKIESCPDVCWLVSLSDTCTGLCSVTVTDSFDTCVECLPPVVEPELKLVVRRVEPGYTTPGCSPEYTEKVLCNFSEIVYDQMIKIRYGITVCCEEDLQKWEIKKELVNLEAIKNTESPCTETDTCSDCGCN